MKLDSKSIHPINLEIQSWYASQKRSLPWREDPIPYKVWLAEIVFQQTRIQQGLPYYYKLTEAYPDVKDLAEAPEEELLKNWEGLGYYSRARNLQASAIRIMEEFDGIFPREHKDILSLKGVGPYTAAAISSVAYQDPYPAIDGNVLRVSSRLFDIEDPIDSSKTYKLIEKELKEIIDHNRPGDFNQGMMELGSLICKPQNPDCSNCPVREYCKAYELGKQYELPKKKSKVKVKDLFFNYFILFSDDKVQLEKRDDGIWKNMYQFPLIESEKRLTKNELSKRLGVMNEKNLIEIKGSSTKHILSHRNIHARFWRLNEEISFDKSISVNSSKINEYPMPRILTRFMESDDWLK